MPLENQQASKTVPSPNQETSLFLLLLLITVCAPVPL